VTTQTEGALLQAGGGAIEAIATLAREGVEATELDLGAYYVIHLGDSVKEIDLTGDRYRDQPRRKSGSVHVRDVPSFAEYWSKHHVNGTSEVYADRAQCRIIAVLDAHGAETAGWAQHRLVLGLEYSEAFKAWLARDGKLMEQEAFAEFLDDNAADIREPSAAEMLEIAQTIQGTSKVDWQASHRLVDGQRRIGYVETNSATAGTKGELAIPQQIGIGVQIFDGAEVAHAITARFRHRISGGKLQLMYKLDRPNDVVTAAFDGAVAELAQACGTAVLRGTPA
jgi:uncharacterized protein YfdQ (DUF2303 family)